jgi:hypothetical protein
MRERPSPRTGTDPGPPRRRGGELPVPRGSVLSVRAKRQSGAAKMLSLSSAVMGGPIGLRSCEVAIRASSYRKSGELQRRLGGHDGYRAIQAIHGVGPIMAAIFVAEIGDVGRFPDARHLCSWAGLTPSHRESDTKVRRGHITKQGSSLVRWAAVEAVARYHGGDAITPAYMRIAKRRGQMIGRVAAARKLLTLVFYGLRDGEIRCLAEKEAS